MTYTLHTHTTYTQRNMLLNEEYMFDLVIYLLWSGILLHCSDKLLVDICAYIEDLVRFGDKNRPCTKPEICSGPYSVGFLIEIYVNNLMYAGN